MRRRLLVLTGIILFAATGTILVRQIFAATTLTFSLYATHPYASKAGFSSSSVNYYTGEKLCTTGAFCPVGQTLVDLGVTQSGELVAGYGDWNKNVDSFGVPEGRVGIVPLNLSTGQWGTITPAGSEALDVIREIGSYIYAPTTDPSDTLGSKSGYATNRSGTWGMVFDRTGAVHTLDVATSNGTDVFTFGSFEGGGSRAVGWRSVDGGATFNESVTDRSTTTVTNYERYYWGAIAGGKLYTRAFSTNPATPTRVFDGNSWQSTATTFCNTTAPRLVVSFANKIVCPGSGSSVTIFDGSSVKTSTYTTTSGALYDYYVKDSYIYVLSSSGVYRSDSAMQNWTFLGTVPTDARSIAVYNNYVYLGGLNGKIFKSTAIDGSTGTTSPTTPTTNITVTKSSPSQLVLDKTIKQVVVEGTGLKDATVLLAGVSTTKVSSTDTQATVTVDTNQLLRKLKLSKTKTSAEISVVVVSTSGTKASGPTILGVRP